MRGDAESAAESGVEMLDAPLSRAIRRTGATVGLLYLLSPEEPVLELTALRGIPADIVSPWRRVALEAPAPLTDAFRNHRLVWLGNQDDFARHYPRAALAIPYLFAMAAAPITAGGTDWGALLLLWPASHPSELSRWEREQVHDACRCLAAFLLKAADSGRAIRPGPEPHVLPPPRARLAGPAEASAAVDFAERLPEGCCSLDLEGRIAFLSSTAAELLGRPRSRLLGALPWEALPWLDDPVYEDRYRAALISRQPTFFTARRPPDRWLTFELFPDSRGISVRITPSVAVEGDGVQERHDVLPSQPFRAGTLYQVMHMAATLTEAVGVRDVIRLVGDQIMPAFGAQGFIMFTLESGRLRVLGHRGYESAVLDRFAAVSLRSPPTPAEYALTNGVAAFFGTPEEMERFSPGITAISDKAAWAFLPLVVSGRAVGCCLLSYDRPHAFSAEERAVLTALAGLIGQALDRARLYDVKHNLAHGLQASLLPAALPAVPGLDVAARYLPATLGLDIGGDFYDLISLEDGTTAAVIGDVQGHNVTAAALMGQVRTAVHAHATAGATPGKVLSHTNRLLTDLKPGLFTSCLYAHIDLSRGEVCLASAGHPPPLLRHPDGQTEVMEVSPGLLLGIEPDIEYPTVEVPLPSRSVLAMYTDGLVESPDVDLDKSIADFADMLKRFGGGDSLESLATALLEHRERPDSLNDDIALLLLRPHPHPAGG